MPPIENNYRDQPGPVATGRDSDYSLTIDDAAALYFRAGHPRTPRSIQRYCASGHLDAIKEATTLGDKYFIEPQSVARHIAQIEELIALDNRTTGRDLSRHVAGEIGQQNSSDALRQGPPTVADVSQSVAHVEYDHDQANAVTDTPRPAPTAIELPSRRVATGESDVSLYVEQLEKRIEEKDDVIVLLKGQLVAKDEQIGEMSTRYRETHTLLGAMQRMIAPLLGQADPYQPADQQSGARVDNSHPSAH